MKSLDPRVNRLPSTPVQELASDHQLITYEVFVQPKEGKPFQHEGIVHAPDQELAFVLAKEAFTRRFSCVSLWVVDTRSITVSATTDAGLNAYETLPITTTDTQQNITRSFEVFHQLKRGKQHSHAGTITASSLQHAETVARALLGHQQACSVWIIPADHLRKTMTTENDLWHTLPEKKFRDATDYKGGDMLKAYLERSQNSLP